ncbi:Uncharacterized protein ALO59_01895 [Pseudomonas amygdali pv. mellea]|uniref:hypothetical protein n=1 Tax=Pseudomonas syringae group TaxID=136849 RepID=UPI0006E6F4D5|nr:MULTISPECIES: hypothetical protein [Pseudomonas syringae group]KPX83673.1 Uncharacterized protein ALO59_01895 [Pseudomonas amygdali pv. mellea]MDU8644369.1 hypothetical protein [Pseudomonas syringae group sp. 26L6]
MARLSLNGWQRLWIVACVALLIALGALAYNGNFPTESRIRQQHSWELADLQNQLECLRLNPQKAQQPRQNITDQILSGQPCLAEDGIRTKQKIDESNKRFEDKLSHLLSLQIESVGWIGAGWLIGCALLYALGALVAWVIRGFRHKGTMTS